MRRPEPKPSRGKGKTYGDEFKNKIGLRHDGGLFVDERKLLLDPPLRERPKLLQAEYSF